MRYDAREAELGEELMRALERFLLLQTIDESWREHLHDMDYLREGIRLRGFAQIEPLVAYKNEAFTLFEDLMNSVWTDFARLIFHVQVQTEAPRRTPAPRAPARAPTSPAAADRRRGRVSYSSGIAGGAGALAPRRRQPSRRRRSARRPTTSSSAASRAMSSSAATTLLVRLGQEVQALPRRMTSAPSPEPTPARLAAMREQLQLLADYL